MKTKTGYKIRYGGSMCDKKERQALIKSIDESIISGGWQAGKEATLMEQEASKFLGVKHGILTTSGSCAGLLALSSLELPIGSEVIIPAVTFPTIYNIILQCNLVPVVVDSKIGSYNLDVGMYQQSMRSIYIHRQLLNDFSVPLLNRVTLLIPN